MRIDGKQVSNPFSEGGGGPHFEAHVQAMFVTLMLTGGHAPCLPTWPIKEIRLQTKIDGISLDDLMVTVENPGSGEKRKLLVQVKHAIELTENNRLFGEVIQAAWRDFNRDHPVDGDRLALITGPPSRISDAGWILNQARHTISAMELLKRVQRTKFSSQEKRKKLAAFQCQLKKANNDCQVPDDVLFMFLRRFFLVQYDLGYETGGTMSLLTSHMSQFTDDPLWAWGRIVDVVQTWNQDAGIITPDNLPEDLRNAFERPLPQTPRTDTLQEQPPQPEQYWNQHQFASDLVFANLLGAWNEKHEADLKIIRELTRREPDVWIHSMRETLQLSLSPVSLNSGQWHVPDRMVLWRALSRRVFDDHLAHLKEVAITVLSERDPKFELPAQDRYAAQVHGAVLKHSYGLRKGLAESLALVGIRPAELRNCSQPGPKTMVALAVRKILENADWALWGSLGNLLPILAEASPDEFLKAVESGLRQKPCPFDELFVQEQKGMLGENLFAGLLRALEALAWFEEYLIRLCIVLGNLDSRDPGGNWVNRPAKSLAGILHPSRPQTYASAQKQKLAVETLQQEFPEEAWKLIRQLSSHRRGYPLRTHRPIWRDSNLDSRRES